MVMTREAYGWKLAGIVEGRLRPEIEHKGFALRVVPSWCDRTDLTTITVTYHDHEFAGLGITLPEIEDNQAEDRAIAWADALLDDPLMERLPEQWRRETRKRSLQIQAEVRAQIAAESHPVATAIAAMQNNKGVR